MLVAAWENEEAEREKKEKEVRRIFLKEPIPFPLSVN